MGILLILIPGCPEERAYYTGTFYCSIGEVPGNYHRFVGFWFQADDMWCEGLWMLSILLEAWQCQHVSGVTSGKN